jgi:hypothetical protein
MRIERTFPSPNSEGRRSRRIPTFLRGRESMSRSGPANSRCAGRNGLGGGCAAVELDPALRQVDDEVLGNAGQRVLPLLGWWYCSTVKGTTGGASPAANGSRKVAGACQP